MSKVTDPEPGPLDSHGPDIADLVCEDIQARKEIGIKTYGIPLRSFNGRKPLRDAYAEILDMAHYVRQELAEREALEERLEGLIRELESVEDFSLAQKYAIDGIRMAICEVRGNRP